MARELKVPGVEIDVTGHVQPRQIHARAHDDRVMCAHALQASCGAGGVATPGVGDDHMGGRRSGERDHLLGKLGTERLDTRDAEG